MASTSCDMQGDEGATAAASGGGGAAAAEQPTPENSHDLVLILDFGSQFSHLIARRVRELHVFCRLLSCECEVKDLSEYGTRLKGVILSGGPSSVYKEGSPRLRPAVWEFLKMEGIPVLGICYGMQEMATHFGGQVGPCEKAEYGFAQVTRTVEQEAARLADGTTRESVDGGLFSGLPEPFKVWMSHGDHVVRYPEGFTLVGKTENTDFAAIVNLKERCFGLQFHPEVTHTPQGTQILGNFVLHICGCVATWDMDHLVDEMIADIHKQVGPTAHVIGAVSGGVDSTVAAVLMTRAIGDRFHAILVDNGCLRLNEAPNVVKRLSKSSDGGLDVDLQCVDASDLFMTRLAGVEDPERKRKIIGGAFIEVFEEAARDINGGDVGFLLQGTLYPDVIESCSYKGPSHTIKSHHNVGGLPACMKMELVEPLRQLFKDEVRSLGLALGISHDSVFRHPFPGPGLAIRMLGAVDREGLDILRRADAIFLEELRRAGLYDEIGQAFAVLLPCKSVGVMGDGRTYERVVAVRAVQTSDFMTADWFHMPYHVLGTVSNRIINEVKGVNRVCYDISSKPPATIEWE